MINAASRPGVVPSGSQRERIKTDVTGIRPRVNRDKPVGAPGREAETQSHLRTENQSAASSQTELQPNKQATNQRREAIDAGSPDSTQ